LIGTVHVLRLDDGSEYTVAMSGVDNALFDVSDGHGGCFGPYATVEAAKAAVGEMVIRHDAWRAKVAADVAARAGHTFLGEPVECDGWFIIQKSDGKTVLCSDGGFETAEAADEYASSEVVSAFALVRLVGGVPVDFEPCSGFDNSSR
jgi:hypothetical protein